MKCFWDIADDLAKICKKNKIKLEMGSNYWTVYLHNGFSISLNKYSSRITCEYPNQFLEVIDYDKMFELIDKYIRFKNFQ